MTHEKAGDALGAIFKVLAKRKGHSQFYLGESNLS